VSIREDTWPRTYAGIWMVLDTGRPYLKSAVKRATRGLFNDPFPTIDEMVKDGLAGYLKDGRVIIFRTEDDPR
jgi:hypothetical protein